MVVALRLGRPVLGLALGDVESVVPKLLAPHGYGVVDDTPLKVDAMVTGEPRYEYGMPIE